MDKFLTSRKIIIYLIYTTAVCGFFISKEIDSYLVLTLCLLFLFFVLAVPHAVKASKNKLLFSVFKFFFSSLFLIGIAVLMVINILLNIESYFKLPELHIFLYPKVIISYLTSALFASIHINKTFFIKHLNTALDFMNIVFVLDLIAVIYLILSLVGPIILLISQTVLLLVPTACYQYAISIRFKKFIRIIMLYDDKEDEHQKDNPKKPSIN